MSARAEAVARWWAGVGVAGRDQAHALARDGGSYLPAELFSDLVDAGVLTVTPEQRRAVADGGASFPMPADIVAYVLSRSERLR